MSRPHIANSAAGNRKPIINEIIELLFVVVAPNGCLRWMRNDDNAFLCVLMLLDDE